MDVALDRVPVVLSETQLHRQRRPSIRPLVADENYVFVRLVDLKDREDAKEEGVGKLAPRKRLGTILLVRTECKHSRQTLRNFLTVILFQTMLPQIKHNGKMTRH